jgi:2,4-dienoyl-CoA reductase-like NADH-dependent reductase (Old Yellow Enzyme family)
MPLFEQVSLGSLVLANRFVRSATYAGMADCEGGCTTRLAALLEEIAEGGVGLLITGHAFVREDGRAGPRQLGMHRDDLVPGFRNLTDRIHRAGCPVVAQLSHAGGFAKGVTGGGLTAGSPAGQIRDAFVGAAARAREAGFDGVQLHAAHGYLLSRLLSPLFNRRTDRYGGGAENRAALAGEIIEGIKRRAGGEFPVLVKMNGSDHADGGMTAGEAARAAAVLAGYGADAVELSGGLLTSARSGPSRPAGVEAYFREEAAAVKPSLTVPLILVGSIRSPATAGELISQGTADMIAMSRPFIREPGLVSRWRRGEREPSGCQSDNRCLRAALAGGVRCARLEKEERA